MVLRSYTEQEKAEYLANIFVGNAKLKLGIANCSELVNCGPSKAVIMHPAPSLILTLLLGSSVGCTLYKN